MISITLEANDEQELIARLESTLRIMGNKIGTPSVVAKWTFAELKELGNKYEKVTYRSLKTTLTELFNKPKLELFPANEWPALIAVLQREMDDAMYASYSSKSLVRF